MSHVLLVNIILIGRSGTEVVCCETARGLRRRNHDVSIYTQHAGPAAEHMRLEGFHVTTDIETVSPPDIIQANQTYPLLQAVGRFPHVPAISICHDAYNWFNEPIDLPSIRRQIAVDLACRDLVAARLPQRGKEIELLHNAVDLDRFQLRGPLPASPKRALVITKNAKDLDALHAACEQRGMAVDAVGPGVGREVDDLPSRVHEYDLVFATARGAIEAMAAGCAVIVVDGRGLAGLVTSDVVADWRENNFGRRLLTREISRGAILDEIDRFDPADARRVSDFVREHASLDRYLDRLEAIHREVIDAGVEVPGTLPHPLAQAAWMLDRAMFAQHELDWSGAPAAVERRLRTEFNEVLAAREAELKAQFDQQASARENALQAEFHQRLAIRESEVRAEFERHALARETAFRTEFDAYRDWTAPQNIGWRILHKIRRTLFKSQN